MEGVLDRVLRQQDSVCDRKFDGRPIDTEVDPVWKLAV